MRQKKTPIQRTAKSMGANINPQDIVDSIEEEFLVIDSGYRVLFANPAVRSRLQEGTESPIGRLCYEVFHNRDRPCSTPLWDCPGYGTPHSRVCQWETMKLALPLPMRMFERAGLLSEDRFTSPVEWMLMSPIGRPGIKVDINNQSSLAGLYASGETTAMQSFAAGLTACATHGAASGRHAARYAKDIEQPDIDHNQVEELRERVFRPMKRRSGIQPDQVLLAVQEAITPYDVWHLRHEKRMNRALEKIMDIRDYLVPLLRADDPHYLRMAHEAANLVIVAEASLRSAIFRRESRIGIREDYPYVDNIDWLKWTELRKQGDRMIVSARDIPIEGCQFQPKPREKFLHPTWAMAEKHGIIKISHGEVKWASEG